MKTVAVLSLLASLASAASLTLVTENFGPNPRNNPFYIYVPDVLPPNPAILVNPHWCHGTAPAAFSGSQYATLASQHGFIVIYPQSSPAQANSDKCWDVSSKETLTHNGGGDSLGVVSMVKWTINKYNADPKRVFVTGVSSGGMMTQVLLGSYPDVFAAGAAFAGVPFGCFAPAGNNTGAFGYWSDDCAKGRVTKTPAQWADLVKSAYPGYDGWRPKLQLFHGTNDEILDYVNHQEGIKQWAEVLGVGVTPVSVTPNTPISGWTKSVYGAEGWLEGYSAAGVPHDIRVQEATVMAFFELACKGEDCFRWGDGEWFDAEPSATTSSVVVSTTGAPVTMTSTSSTSVRVTTPSATSTSSRVTTTFVTSTSTAAPVAGQPLWAQCGGMGFNGPTACAVGTCTIYNPYYAQCVPRTGVPIW
ncbi:hypothetical protein QC761_512620 [Podospora bellae-mahoneyi]|uniref:Carboxylic ester hydrolase n=1 Tax=Podospora bellae-mahoneyi TaxID=2093777 RepID=A0ABR0FEE4_9PEZI|nr:hypothetical protein QC761_512620 [Podospora bellae-mahoneyi]